VRVGMTRKIRAARRKEQRGEIETGEASARIRAYQGALACFD